MNDLIRRTIHPAPRRRSIALGLGVVLLGMAPAAAGAVVVSDEQRADSARRGAQFVAGTADAASSNITGQLATVLPAGGLHAADVFGPGAPRSVAEAIRASWAAAPPPATGGAVGVQLTVARGIGTDPRRIPRPAAGSGEPVNRSFVAEAAAIFSTNQFAGDLIGTMYTLIGLSETEVTTAPQAWLDPVAAYVAAAQTPRIGFPDQGGWGFSKPATIPPPAVANPGVDTTGVALAALCRAGLTVETTAVARALNYLDAIQDQATGGFGNVNATGSVVIGLKTCGVEMQGERWTTAAGENPISRLLSLQRPDGSWPFPDTGTTANTFATQDAVRAIAPGRTGYATPRPLRADPTAPADLLVATAEPGQLSLATLVVDYGGGPERIRTCAVPVTVGADAETVLAAAAVAGRPSGCVRAANYAGAGADRRLASLDGVSEVPGRGWTFRVDGGPATAAAGQAVTRTGSVLFVRYEGIAVPNPAATAPPEPVVVAERVQVDRVVDRVVERTAPAPSTLRDTTPARVSITGLRARGSGRGRRIEVGGLAGGPAGAVVTVRIARIDGPRCSPLGPRGTFGAPRSCRTVRAIRVAGAGLWSLRVPLRGGGRVRLLVQAAVERDGVAQASARRRATVR